MLPRLHNVVRCYLNLSAQGLACTIICQCQVDNPTYARFLATVSRDFSMKTYLIMSLGNAG